MDQSISPDGKEQEVALNRATAGSVLWQCIVDAAIKTFLILVLGSVAIGLVGGVFHHMAPSPPPGIKAKSLSDGLDPFTSAFQKHRVAIVFALVFGLTTWARLRPSSAQGNRSPAVQAAQRFSANWFGVLVSNAFGAMGIAIALYWLERASLSRWIYSWMVAAVLPTIAQVGNFLLGKARVDSISIWLGWYAENQLKFNFWLIYVAAICDDLGIPNVKSLGRWIWRWFRTRWTTPQLKPNTSS